MALQSAPPRAVLIELGVYQVDFCLCFYEPASLSSMTLRSSPGKASLTSGVLIASIHSGPQPGTGDSETLGMLTSGCPCSFRLRASCSLRWLLIKLNEVIFWTHHINRLILGLNLVFFWLQFNSLLPFLSCEWPWTFHSLDADADKADVMDVV